MTTSNGAVTEDLLNYVVVNLYNIDLDEFLGFDIKNASPLSSIELK